MINLRKIFIPTYSIIGILLITTIIILIMLLKNNLKESMYQIGKSMIASGIILIILNIIINVCVYIIPSKYQIFIRVISSNLSKNITYGSIITITTGIILIILSKKSKIEV